MNLYNRDTHPIHNPSPLQPSPVDIICGRGFHIVNHQGNFNLHLLANKYRDQYLRSTRGEKAKIVNRVLSDIKTTGARFIRNVSDGNGDEGWTEVDEATASKKVSHALRLRTKNKSNRHNIDIAATGSQINPQVGDSNTDVLHQLQVGCKEVKETPVPSATKTNSPSQRGIVTADPTDIICGRGLHIVDHRGNLNLHLMVNAYREEYFSSRRSEKRKITKHILDKITSTGARFIRKVSDAEGAEKWEVVDDETAYKKVSHALRLRTTNKSNHKNGTFTAEPKLTVHGDSNPGTSNQPVTMRELNAAVQSNTLSTTALAPPNLTMQNVPTAASISVAPLWAVQVPLAQPTYEDLVRQQQYNNFWYTVMQQLAHQPHR